LNDVAWRARDEDAFRYNVGIVDEVDAHGDARATGCQGRSDMCGIARGGGVPVVKVITARMQHRREWRGAPPTI